MRRILSVSVLFAVCLVAARTATAQAAPGANAPASSSANPFPEDTSSVPVLPSRETITLPPAGAPGGPENSSFDSRFLLANQDTDPVRSPDDATAADVNQTGEAYSSSLKGTENLQPPPDEDKVAKRNRTAPAKELTHQDAAAQDIQVGSYYLDRKNWRAALSRFQSALILDPENPEVYFGLAEAQKGLGLFADARSNYLKLLDYDPDGKHAKQAQKALKDSALEGAALRPAPSKPAAQP